jgi:hypothetical protein
MHRLVEQFIDLEAAVGDEDEEEEEEEEEEEGIGKFHSQDDLFYIAAYSEGQATLSQMA